jgi:hypothetical protein
MIRISCTNCKTILSIDDAFAGGVCRCQHCGTIQTVPAQARQTAQVGQAASKSLYQNDARSAGSGLDDLADIVVSSGLASSRLTRPPGATGSRGKQNLMPFIVAGTVVVALLLVVIVILLTRNSGQTPPTGSTVTSPNGSVITPTLAANTPSFCGTKLDGNTIIYLLDCGSSSGGYLGELKDAAIKSIGSLGPDRKFQILFWNDGSGAYPDKSTTYANKENIDAAQKTIEDVAPFGQSDVKTAMQSAMAQHPDVLIIATGKGFDLDNKWFDDVMAIRGSSPVKIDTYSLDTNGETAALKKLAAQTGGSYHELTTGELRAFGQ